MFETDIFVNCALQECGPKGLHADIGSLKRLRIIDIWLAKKFLLVSARRGI
jgi:hypothetical protein